MKTSRSTGRYIFGEEFARDLAERKPKALVALIEYGDLEPSDMFFFAEWAGNIRTREVVQLLKKILYSDVALEREGAVYGLGKLVDVDGVEEILKDRLATETSDCIKQCIADALDVG